MKHRKRGAWLSALMLVSVLLAWPQTAMAASVDVTVRPGETGSYVKQIQQKLKDKGYFKHDECTGYYGIITQQAVEDFQDKNDLECDGIAGPKTLKTLLGSKSYESFAKSALQNGARPTGSGTPNTAGDGKGHVYNGKKYSESSLIPGDEGSEVTKVQKRLKELGFYTYSKITGFYGPITMEAVQKFQSASGLASDGIAGVNTKSTMNGSGAITAAQAKKKATGTASSSSSQKAAAAQSNNGKSAAQNLIEYGKQFLGKPYVYGTSGPDAFDCTGFTCYVYKQYGYSLPRSAYDQGYKEYGTKITSPDKLQPGDLVFFNTINDNDVSDHAGIYIGNGQFIHAGSGSSTGRKVKISPLDSGYYKTRFSWGRRVLE